MLQKRLYVCARGSRVHVCAPLFGDILFLTWDLNLCVCVCVHVRRDAVLPCDVEITWRIFTETHFSACIVILVSGRGYFESHLTTLANLGILI